MSLSQGSPFSNSSFLRLPLLKYSYANHSASHSGPFPWTHCSGNNDLFAIFENVNVESSNGEVKARSKLRILKDPVSMEDLDMQTLSEEAHRAMTMVHDPIAHSNDPRVVAVVVRAPLIAMRYPLAMGQVRRFQVRFANDESYYEAMKILARANVPTLEAGSFPARRPQMTSANPNKAAANISTLPSHQEQQLQASAIQPTTPSTTTIPQTRFATDVQIQIPLRDQKSHATPVLSNNISGYTKSDPHSSKRLSAEEVSPQGGSAPYEVEPTLTTDMNRPPTFELTRDPDHDLISSKQTDKTISPIGLSQSLEKLLPARRELPFEKPNTRSRSSLAKMQDKEEKTVLEKPAPVTKRKASTTKPSSNAKARKAESREAQKRSQPPKTSVESTNVPSLDDLYKSLDSFKQQDRFNDAGTLDTQALLNRVDQRAQNGTDTIVNGSPHVPGTSNSATPSENNFANKNHVSENYHISGGNKFSSATNRNEPITPNVPTTAECTESMAALMKDAAFAQSAMKLREWNDLPIDKQHEALRSYIRSQYNDPGFLNLCRMLQGVSETLIVYPSTEHSS